MKRFLAAVAVSAALMVPAYAAPADDGHAVVVGWIAAFNAENLEATVGFYRPDALVWTTSGRAIATGTDAFRAYFTGVFANTLTATLGDNVVLAVSDTLVIDAGRIDVLNVVTGVISPLRYHFVLVKTGDVWSIAAHHSSRLPDPPATPAPAPAVVPAPAR